MWEKLTFVSRGLFRWLRRTPVGTFVLCPLIVVTFEIALHYGKLPFVPWGLPLVVGVIFSTSWWDAISCRSPAAAPL
jgi:hypothetical protein